jgi:hypothetical protein
MGVQKDLLPWMHPFGQREAGFILYGAGRKKHGHRTTSEVQGDKGFSG